MNINDARTEAFAARVARDEAVQAVVLAEARFAAAMFAFNNAKAGQQAAESTKPLEVGQTVTFGGHPIGGKPSRVYTGEVLAIKNNRRAGLDVTIRHDHGGEQTLTSVRPDFFN